MEVTSDLGMTLVTSDPQWHEGYKKLNGEGSREKAKGRIRGVETMLQDLAVKANWKMADSWRPMWDQGRLCFYFSDDR